MRRKKKEKKSRENEVLILKAGLYQHFKAVAEVGLPVVLYNVPGRSGAALTPKTIARLARISLF